MCCVAIGQVQHRETDGLLPHLPQVSNKYTIILLLFSSPSRSRSTVVDAGYCCCCRSLRTQHWSRSRNWKWYSLEVNEWRVCVCVEYDKSHDACATVRALKSEQQQVLFQFIIRFLFISFSMNSFHFHTYEYDGAKRKRSAWAIHDADNNCCWTRWELCVFCLTSFLLTHTLVWFS